MDLPVFVFDGDCAFCSSTVRYAVRHLRPSALVVPWQRADLDALGLTIAQVDAAVAWVARDGSVSAGPVAVARLLRDSSRWWWRAGGSVLATRPVLWVAWPAYRWIARNRHRMPGGTAACALPIAQRAVTLPTDGGAGNEKPAENLTQGNRYMYAKTSKFTVV